RHHSGTICRRVAFGGATGCGVGWGLGREWMVGRVPPQVAARGPTSLGQELSTCWVWRRHMVRALYGMRLVECMRGWVRGYRLCVVVQSFWEMVGRFLQAMDVLAKGLTALWHELSTCWVWRRHMVRPLYDMRLVECMRGWVRGYWLCVVMQSVS
ncbi:hypothetical protein TGCAST_389950, partial [Toxoplasma gondii CAST]